MRPRPLVPVAVLLTALLAGCLEADVVGYVVNETDETFLVVLTIGHPDDDPAPFQRQFEIAPTTQIRFTDRTRDPGDYTLTMEATAFPLETSPRLSAAGYLNVTDSGHAPITIWIRADGIDMSIPERPPDTPGVD